MDIGLQTRRHPESSLCFPEIGQHRSSGETKQRTVHSRPSSVLLGFVYEWIQAFTHFPLYSIECCKRFFSSLQCPNRLWGSRSLLSNGNRGIFPWEVKRPKREGDNSSPSSAEVKNDGAIPPLSNMSSWHGAYLKSIGITLPQPLQQGMLLNLNIHIEQCIAYNISP
jgi:hypothetical protein